MGSLFWRVLMALIYQAILKSEFMTMDDPKYLHGRV